MDAEGRATSSMTRVAGTAAARYTQNKRAPGMYSSFILNTEDTKLSGRKMTARMVNRVTLAVSAKERLLSTSWISDVTTGTMDSSRCAWSMMDARMNS